MTSKDQNLNQDFEKYETQMEYILRKVFSFISSTFQLNQMLIYLGCYETQLEFCKCKQSWICLSICLASQNDAYQVLQ